MAQTQTSSETHPTSPTTRSMQVRVLAGASIGQFVEFYDFALYGLSALILAQHFFPSESAFVAMLGTFGAFAVAFLVRPIGGLFFGALGDKIGRRPVLFITLLTIAAATVGIGLLPSFQSIGVAAPILLVLLRLVQGFSAGGESVGAPAFVLEHAPVHRRGLWICITLAATALPGVFAGAVILLVNLLAGAEAYAEWAWRIPFWIALPLSLVGFWIRSRTEESEEFKQVLRAQEGKEFSPVREAIRTNGKEMLQVMFVCGLTALCFYYLSGYFVAFLQTSGDLSREAALGMTAIVMLILSFGAPYMGNLTDKVGRRPMLILGSGLVAVISVPAFMLITAGSYGLAFLGMLLFIVPLCVYAAGSSTFFIEVFQTKTRFTSAAISYNIGYGIVGGTAPLIGTWLVERTGSVLSPGWYLAVFAAVVFVLIFITNVKETNPYLRKDNPLSRPE